MPHNDDEGDEIRRTIHPKDTNIETDLEDLAVVVNYIVEITHVDSMGRIVETEKLRERKKVKLRKNLKPSSNVGKLAGEVMKKCPYIHESKRQDLERAIQELQHVLIRDELRATTWKREEEPPVQRQEEDQADMGRLDNYIMLLYEGKDKDDVAQKIHGTAQILILCSDVANLEHLVQHKTLMQVLTRVLAEEYKKSVELCYNIMRCLLAFSNFAEMHRILKEYCVGNVTMKIIELEIQRSLHREEERKKRHGEYEKTVKTDTRPGSGVAETARKLMDKIEKEDMKDKIRTRQQDKLLFVCFHVLINLAEDSSAERKMVKKNLIVHLSAVLDHTSANLLYLVATFFKKLSVFDENKERAKIAKVAGRIVKFVPCSCEPLTVMSLRLLFNLSFDAQLREQMLKGGLIPRLVEMLKKPQYRARCLRLLYHMSMDERCRNVFAYTEAVPLIMQLIYHFPEGQVLRLELAALAVNLSLNQKIALAMTQQRGLQHLMERVRDCKDANLMKTVRNISQWTYHLQTDPSIPGGINEYRHKYANLWGPLVDTLLELVEECESHDLLVEVIGTLGNLTEHDLPKNVGWAEVVSEYRLGSLLSKLLVPGMVQADVVLEVIVLIGTLSHDADAAVLLGAANIIQTLEGVWKDKCDDAEIRLQMLVTLWRLLMVKDTRDIIMYRSSHVSEIMDALRSRHNRTRDIANMCAEIIVDYDRGPHGEPGPLADQVLKRRFYAFNEEWIQAMMEYDGQASPGVREDVGGNTPLRHGHNFNYANSSDESSDSRSDGGKVSLRHYSQDAVSPVGGTNDMDNGWGPSYR